MNDFLIRTGKIIRQIDELAAISDDQQCITRSFGTKAFMEGRSRVREWMQQAGLQTTIDNIGNLRGKLLSKNAGALTFVIASHIDTVVNAGKFDGPLGVLMGLDLCETLLRTGVELPFNIELIAFSDEEGVRFHTTFLGSRVVAGNFDMELLAKLDEKGNSLSDVIHDMSGDASLLPDDALAAKYCLGYFEMHIEQGPVLYENGKHAAIVTAIAGQSRMELTFRGMPGHAGTVPMDMRQDALCCAAEFILKTEKFALEHKTDIVATIGKLHVTHSASNVIAGEVICSLDVRSAHDDVRLSACESIKQFGLAICTRRNIEFDWKIIQQTASVFCDERLNELLLEAFHEAGHEEQILVSGAGHDAVPMSSIAPVSMLFIRCFKGISHNPLENAEAKDIAAALEIGSRFIDKLIQKYK